MENKYFTPDMEDIRVGYEYESLRNHCARRRRYFGGENCLTAASQESSQHANSV